MRKYLRRTKFEAPHFSRELGKFIRFYTLDCLNQQIAVYYSVIKEIISVW